MKKKLLNFIICPVGHDVLSLDEENNLNELDCIKGNLISTSGREYPIINGIANLIPKYEEKENIYKRKTKSYTEILLDKNFTPDWISRMDSLRISIDNLTDKYIKTYMSGVVLEIGAGWNLLRNKYQGFSDEWISVDFDLRSDKIDIRADGQCLPFKEECINTIVSIDVLEHIPDPEKAIKEMYRVLKPGGIVILSTPFFFWLHEEPFDFHRFSKYGLKNDFERNGFKVIEVEPISGVITIAGILISIFITKVFKFSKPLLKFFLVINKFVQKHLFIPIDKLLDKRKRLAQGHFIVAQKV